MNVGDKSQPCIRFLRPIFSMFKKIPTTFDWNEHIKDEANLASRAFQRLTMDRQKLLKVFFFASLILAGEVLLFSIRWIVAIALLGIGIGVIFSPGFDFLHRKWKFPRVVSNAAAGLAVLVFIIVAGFIFFDLVTDQVNSIAQKMPQLLELAVQRAASFSTKYPWIENVLATVRQQVSIQNVAQQILQGFKLGTAAIATVVFVFVIAVYVAINPTYYYEGILSLTPQRYRMGTAKSLAEIATNLRKWFQSQLLAMAIVGLLTSIALRIIGVEYWLLFGILTGLLDIIPYIGPTIPAAGAILVTFASNPEKLPWIIGAYVLIHQTENNIVVPNIMKHRMHFPPVPLMIAMLAMGSWFGVLGLLLTPGLFTVGMTLNAIRARSSEVMKVK
jgi:predicted PurR-regulated permease PerM